MTEIKFPVPAKTIYASFCRAEREISNAVNYRMQTEKR